MSRRFISPGLESLRDEIRGAQDLARQDVQLALRGGVQQEAATGNVIFWNFIYSTVTIPAGATQRILSAAQKPVEFLRFESVPGNTTQVTIGAEGVAPSANGTTVLLPGQAIQWLMEGNSYEYNEYIDASQYFAANAAAPVAAAVLLVTLGYRDQRVQAI